MKTVYQTLQEETEKIVNRIEKKIVNSYSELYDNVEFYESVNPCFIKKIMKKLILHDFKKLEEHVRKALLVGTQLEFVDEGNKYTALAMKKADLSLDQLFNMRLKRPLYYHIRSNLIEKLKEAEII